VGKSIQHIQAHAYGIMGFAAQNIGYNADATRVVLKGWVV
jgi:hypothetical protein